jgi:hypothetical protein
VDIRLSLGPAGHFFEERVDIAIHAREATSEEWASTSTMLWRLKGGLKRLSALSPR